MNIPPAALADWIGAMTSDPCWKTFPEIEFMRFLNLPASKTFVPDHVHATAMEITFLDRGDQIFSVGDQTHRVRGNEWFVTKPGEQHGTGHRIEAKGRRFSVRLEIDPAREPFLDLPQEQGRELVGNLIDLPHRHFRGCPASRAIISNLFGLSQQEASPLARLSFHTALVRMLLHVIERGSEDPHNPLSADIQTVVNHVRQMPGMVQSVEEMARMAHLSESRFQSKFKEQVGVPPMEYVLRKRFEKARLMLLETDATITQVAFEMGFSSSQYFATVYRRYTGESPSEWRRKYRQHPDSKKDFVSSFP